jgi:hypothetical protein
MLVTDFHPKFHAHKIDGAPDNRWSFQIPKMGVIAPVQKRIKIADPRKITSLTTLYLMVLGKKLQAIGYERLSSARSPNENINSLELKFQIGANGLEIFQFDVHVDRLLSVGTKGKSAHCNGFTMRQIKK